MAIRVLLVETARLLGLTFKCYIPRNSKTS